MFKLDLEKAEEPEMKLSTSVGSLKEQESSRKTSTSDLLKYAKAFDCVDYNKLRKILNLGMPVHFIYLLRTLCAGQEEKVRTGHGTTDWFQIRKEACQLCILLP